MGILSNAYDAIELGHFNWPIRNSHPIHPMTVHFPLTFLSSAYTLDVLYGATSAYRHLALFAPMAKFIPQISQLAFLTHALGVVTSIPSMTSGTSEFWEIYKKDGLNRKDKLLTNPGASGEEVINSSIKIGMWHGILNTAAFGYSSYAVWSRWGLKGFPASRAQILISALMIPAVGVSAAFGGDLVYGKGIGVQRMGPALEEKEAGIREQKKAGL